MTLSVTILGCGSSGGVPRPAAGWGACDPSNPLNRRRRCSVLIERSGPGGRTSVLVDTSPDLREQLLDAEVATLDAVVLTHEHADHTHGIDDLRPVVQHMRRRLETWMDAPTAAVMHARFGYVFATPPGSAYPPILVEKRIEPGTPFRVEGAGGVIEFRPFDLQHGSITALGLRVGGLAYTPDVSAIPEAALPALVGLDLWIVDALRPTPHPTHFSLAEALGWIDRLKPRLAVLTDLHTDLDHGHLVEMLPAGIRPAHDGMRIELAPDGSVVFG